MLIVRAERLLYRAKANGRNRVERDDENGLGPRATGRTVVRSEALGDASGAGVRGAHSGALTRRSPASAPAQKEKGAGGAL